MHIAVMAPLKFMVNFYFYKTPCQLSFSFFTSLYDVQNFNFQIIIMIMQIKIYKNFEPFAKKQTQSVTLFNVFYFISLGL